MLRSYPLEPVVLVPWATFYQLSGSGSMGIYKQKRSYPLEPVVLVPWATFYQLSGSGSMGIYKQKRSYPLEPVVLVPWATFYQLSRSGSMDIYKQEILPSGAGCYSPMGNILPAVRKWKHGYLQTRDLTL